MNRSIFTLLMIGGLIFSTLFTGKTVSAQVISLPAEMNKSFSPISIASGGTSRLNVTIYNPNFFTLTNASWTDNLIGVQSGLTIASPVGLTNSCGGSVTAVAGSTTLSLHGGTVPAQVGTSPGSCTVSINVTGTIPGNLINTIPVGELTSTGSGTTITNTSPASATLNVTGVQPPSVSKSFSSSTIWAGQISQLSIVIANNHPSVTLTQASLVDNLPANVVLADPVSSTLTGCGSSAALTAVAGGTSVTLNNATIAPSSTCMIRVNVTSNTQGAYTNRIPASTLKTQQGLTNATPATARLAVREIGVIKRFSPSTIVAGDTTTLTITLQNPKSTPYTGVNVIDDLPSPLVVNGAATSTCGVPPGVVSTTSTSVSLTGGTIPAGSVSAPGTCTISVPVTAPTGTLSGVLTNIIPAARLTTDQGIGNLSSATATVTVSGTDVAVTKSFSPSNIPAGGNARLRIDIVAPSDTNLTNFSVTDNLPAGVTVSNSTPPAVTGCGATPPLVLNADTNATTISITGGLILAGQRCRIDVYVTSSVPNVYTNTILPANITNTEGRVPTDAISTALTVTGSGALSMALVKGFDPLTVFGGSASKMSVQLINLGAVALTGIGFSDDMPDGMILANPVNFDVGTCGGTLSGVPGDGSFSFSGGSLPPFGTCVITLKATMTVNGNLTNIIPVGAVVTANGTITNVDPAAASLTNLPGAGLSKFFSPNPIVAGAPSQLTITIQNTGGVSLSGMGLKDVLPGSPPAGLVVADPPGVVNNCGGTLSAAAGSQTIELTNGVLAANSSCTIVVSVTGSVAGGYTNTIPPGALTSNEGTTNNNNAEDTLTVTASASGGGGSTRGRGNNGTGNPASAKGTGGSFLIPVTGFSPNVNTELDNTARPSYNGTGLRMEIPVIKVNAPIVGVELINGGWDVSWLQNQAGWLNGTAYPTWKGNSVITAHVVNADGKPGLFSRLKYLDTGEYIFVYSSGYRYTYKVVSNEFVQPDDANVLKHEDKSYLTLVTCDQYDEQSDTYLRRAVVRAQLVDMQLMK